MSSAHHAPRVGPRRGHSIRPTFDQIRAVFRLIGDVRAAGTAGVLAQRQMLVDGACNLLDADQGFLSEFDDWLPGRTPREVATVPGNQIDPHCVEFTRQWYAEQAVERDAMGAALFEVAGTPGPQAITWSQVRKTKRPADYREFYELLQTIRVTDILDPMHRHASGHFVAISLTRMGGARRRPFNARERAVAQLLAEELSWLHETRRIDVRELVGLTLPPRQRELLSQMLTERSMKQIAAAMGLSVHTARSYTNELYKRLGVTSREELMVRYLTGGCPAGRSECGEGRAGRGPVN